MENTNKKKKRKPTVSEWVGVRPAPTAVGEVIRKSAKRYNLKISQLETALEQANKNHPDGWKVRDSKGEAEGGANLVHNYIYRSWPDISQDTTLNIICEAFESLLPKRYSEEEIQAICKRLKEEIRAVYKGQAAKDEVRIVSDLGLQHTFDKIHPEYALFVSRNLAAFSSLTEWDIHFWNTLTTWSEEKRKKTYESWRKQKADYQTIISPAFQQWMTLRSKNYSDSARKPRKETLTPSKKFLAKLQKLTSEEANSVCYVIDRLKQRSGSAEKGKYPLAPPMELDLLILFKYCLPERIKNQYIDQFQKEQKKAAGDG